MSQSIAPGNHRPSRQFRALLRRDLGVAAPIALTAAALLAVAASALAALPLLGRAAMDALAVPPAAGLAERLSLLPELVRIVLLLIPGWCAAAMAIADRTHRSGALGAALPMDPRQARRARAVALLAIVALLALWLAVLPGDVIQEPPNVGNNVAVLQTDVASLDREPVTRLLGDIVTHRPRPETAHRFR